MFKQDSGNYNKYGLVLQNIRLVYNNLQLFMNTNLLKGRAAGQVQGTRCDSYFDHFTLTMITLHSYMYIL